jgi:hypothetical protein
VLPPPLSSSVEVHYVVGQVAVYHSKNSLINMRLKIQSPTRLSYADIVYNSLYSQIGRRYDTKSHGRQSECTIIASRRHINVTDSWEMCIISSLLTVRKLNNLAQTVESHNVLARARTAV